MEEVKLYSSQVAHVRKLQWVLDRSPFALDFSSLGSGEWFDDVTFSNQQNGNFEAAQDSMIHVASF
jgi:hypothetical protein